MRVVSIALGLVLVVASATPGRAQDQKQTDSLDKAKAEKVQEPKKPKIKRDPNMISAAEMEELRLQYQNMYDLIERARPRWLRSRGLTTPASSNLPVATVFLNEQKFGALEALRSISPAQIQTAKWLSGPDANMRWGRGNDSGAIVLTTIGSDKEKKP